MKIRVPSLILVAMIWVSLISAQNLELSKEKAFVSNAYGEFSEEAVRSMFDTFFAELSERKGSRGIVVVHGPIKELADRKDLMSKHIQFRRFNPLLIEYRF